MVAWNDTLHVFYTDANNLIKVFVIDAAGDTAGPFALSDEFTTWNGGFDAAVFNNHIYLVFPDWDNELELTIAKCDAPSCTAEWSWQSFGTSRKKVLDQDNSYDPHVAAVAANRVNGLSSNICSTYNSYLFIACKLVPDGKLRILRMDATDSLVGNPYTFPEDVPESVFPSTRSQGYFGLTVRDSAFDQICLTYSWPIGWHTVSTPRRYIYLAWQDKGSKKIYTAILQNASSSKPWLTTPVDALWEAKSETGVNWVRGRDPDEAQSITFEDGAEDVFNEVFLYGKY